MRPIALVVAPRRAPRKLDAQRLQRIGSNVYARSCRWCRNAIDREYSASSHLDKLGEFATVPIVCLAARFTRMKGHEVLLKALSELRARKQTVHAIIAGQPLFSGEREYYQHINDLIARLDLQKQVRLVGWVDDLPAFYAASDIVVHPCTAPDTFPSSVLEAMAASRPVIASQIGGLPEMVLHEHMGLLVKPGDHIALADAILELVTHPEKAKRFGANGRKRASLQFDDRSYGETIMGIYDDLCGLTASTMSGH